MLVGGHSHIRQITGALAMNPELAVKRDSKVSWSLGVRDGGTVDGDRQAYGWIP